MAAGMSLPAACRCTGVVAAFPTQAMSSRDTWSLSCLSVLDTLYLWHAAVLLLAWARGKDAGQNAGIFAFS